MPHGIPASRRAAEKERNARERAAARDTARAAQSHHQPVTRPTADQNLDAQIDHAANLLRATQAHRNPVIRASRAAVIAALEALHLVHELTPAQPAAAAPPVPKPVAPPTRPVLAPSPRVPRAYGPEINERAVVTEYNAGDTAPAIAQRHDTTPARVRRILERNNVELRDDRTGHSGGSNRLEPTPELLADLRRQYVDEQQTIADLAEQHNIHRRVITRFLTDAGVTIRPPAHLRGTDLTPDQVKAIVDGYRDGTPIHELARRHRVRATTARLLLIQAGIEVRATKGASAHIAERLEDLGVTAKDVKKWAYDNGLIERVGPGLVATTLVEQYAQAHTDHHLQPTGS